MVRLVQYEPEIKGRWCRIGPRSNNPHHLTVEQVGRGWRLLDRDEVGSGLRRASFHIQSWCASKWMGEEVGFAWEGANVGACYRTKLTRKQLAALHDEIVSI